MNTNQRNKKMTNKLTRLELTWPGKEDRFNPEPRILLEDKEKSFSYEADTAPTGLFEEQKVNPTYDNMLIHGDNLLALKALEQDYTGKIKCIYIDPPYNTGNAFEHYDDGLEHSIWLSLMRDRLEILRRLLSEDGVIIIHIDDNEQAYLKVLMDSIFGRSSFVNNIVVRDSHPSGLKLSAKEKTIIKTKSYMLVYKKGPEIKINPIYQKRELWDTHFNSYVDISSFPLIKRSLKEVLIERKIIEKSEKIDEFSLMNPKFKEFVFSNQDKIFQSTKEIPDEPKEKSLANPDTVVEYIGSEQSRNFAYNGRRLSPLSKSIQDIGIDGSSERYFAKLQCDFWDDIDFNNSQNEGGVAFAASKKPEYLIARLLTMFSNKGDIILDSFLGSGTTAAVAHKMGRRWIGIEMGEHAYTHCLKRLKSVINGTDKSGISKIINWTCGGGFKFYELASSLIVKDSFGMDIISPEYNADMLAEAMCKVLGYHYKPDTEKYWKQGYSSEKSFIYTTTMGLQETSLAKIAEEVGDNNLLICCKAFMGNPNNYPNITVKKIPTAILSKCEWGRAGYPLNLKDYTPKDEDFEFDEGEE